MTPNIALDLSLDAISVLWRAADAAPGHWMREGKVRLDAPDMAKRLGRLRDRAIDRVGGDFTSILILPDSQLLFTSLERDDRRPEETIRSLLRGRTPYAVEDLAFDFIQKGDRLQVAVVALETLLEAETFAADFGFRPVALVANPDDPIYPGLPNFGSTGIAPELLKGERLDLDLGDSFTIKPVPRIEKPAMPAPAAVKLPPVESMVQPRMATPAPPPRAKAEPSKPAPIAKTSESSAVKAPAEAPKPAAPETIAKPPEPTSVTPKASKPIVIDERPKTPISKAPAPVVTDPDQQPAAAPPAPSGVEPKQTSKAADVVPPTELSATHEEPARRAEPVLGKPTKVDTAPTPSFSSNRKDKSAPPVPATPALDRIQPRLTRPGDNGMTPPKPDAKPAAPKVPKFAQSTPSDAKADLPRLPDEDTRRTGLLTRLLGRVSRNRNTRADADEVAKFKAAAEARASEAAALALPGLARDEVAASPAKRPSARGGFYMTLALLAVLGGVGLWSAFTDPAAPSGQVATAARVDLPPTTELTPAGDAEVEIEAPAPVATDTAALLPPTGPDPITGDASVAPGLPADEDVAILLPESGDSPVPAGVSVPDLVAPPVPLPGATDEELAANQPPLPSAESEAEAEAESFEAAGLFVAPDAQASAPRPDTVEDVSLVAIAPIAVESDTVTLPLAIPPSDAFAPRTLPAPTGTQTPVEADGTAPEPDTEIQLVAASTDGTLAPGGYVVVSGRPEVMPVPRGAAVIATDTDTFSEEELARREVLSRVRPVERPTDGDVQVLPAAAETGAVEEVAEDDPIRAALSRLRPVPRPESAATQRQLDDEARAAAQAAAAAAAAAASAEAVAAEQAELDAAVLAAQQAAAASLASRQEDAAAALAAPQTESGPASGLAIAQSVRPSVRPRGVERVAAQIVTQRREQAAAAARTPPAREVDRSQQTTRSPGNAVARAATDENVLRLNRINLIGVYGQPQSRRALVRLGNGRYVKVEVGDRLDRGRVTAIGESELSYQRGGRNVVLRLPNA